jgi:RimJ/RimL family protein N-acetyltransferase
VRIETERLLLRRVEESDAPVLARLWADPKVTRYMGGPRDFEKVQPELEEEAREGLFIPPGGGLWWREPRGESLVIADW